MKKIKHLLLLPMVAAIFLLSCNDHTDDLIRPIPAERTVIAYMVANNNLAYDGWRNINDMERAFSAEFGGRLLLFYNDAQGNCRLYDIQHDEDANALCSPMIKEYPYKTNPCLPATLSSVIADCRDYAGVSNYSMIFWSHGSGWLPQGMSPAKVIKEENPSDREQSAPQYTFGATNSFGDQLEIWQLAEALPKDMVFDYISFDACYMASIELIYQLRHNARYIISSPAEILAEGFPYTKGLKAALTADVIGMSRTFFDHYNAKSGVYRSATTSVVDCSKLDELSASVKELVAKGGEPYATQQFGRNLGGSANYSNLLWDMSDMIYSTWGVDDCTSFIDAMNAAVIYKATTPMLFEGDYYGSIVVNKFSGMTIYIPKLSQPKTLEIYTTHYDWAKDTKLYTLAK